MCTGLKVYIFFSVVQVVQKTTSVCVCVWIDDSRQHVYCKISSWDQPFSLSWLCIYLVFVAVRGVRDSLWICQEIYRLLQCKSLEAPECWIITGVTPCTEIHLEQSLNKHIFIQAYCINKHTVLFAPCFSTIWHKLLICIPFYILERKQLFGSNAKWCNYSLHTPSVIL